LVKQIPKVVIINFVLVLPLCKQGSIFACFFIRCFKLLILGKADLTEPISHQLVTASQSV